MNVTAVLPACLQQGITAYVLSKKHASWDQFVAESSFVQASLCWADSIMLFALRAGSTTAGRRASRQPTAQLLDVNLTVHAAPRACRVSLNTVVGGHEGL